LTGERGSLASVSESTKIRDCLDRDLFLAESVCVSLVTILAKCYCLPGFSDDHKG
jgi:hypothetical protein